MSVSSRGLRGRVRSLESPHSELCSTWVLEVGVRGPRFPRGPRLCAVGRTRDGHGRLEVAGGSGLFPCPSWALTAALLCPAGSGGSTPSLPACGPCCWGCTSPSSTCRLPRPAGWTRSSSAPRPCAAWWASRQPWPQGRRQAHGGSGPEGQRSSSDCGGRTDRRTGSEQGPSDLRRTCHTPALAQPRAPVLSGTMKLPSQVPSSCPPLPLSFWPKTPPPTTPRLDPGGHPHSRPLAGSSRSPCPGHTLSCFSHQG